MGCASSFTEGHTESPQCARGGVTPPSHFTLGRLGAKQLLPLGYRSADMKIFESVKAARTAKSGKTASTSEGASENSDTSESEAECSPRSSCASAATSDRLYAEAGQTVLFLDWDDTLFPTTELIQRRGHWVPSGRHSPGWGTPPPLKLNAELEDWRQALQQLISTARALSERCVIITNASPSWVRCCLKKFAPELLPDFERSKGGLHVIYAPELLNKYLEAHGLRIQPVNPSLANLTAERRERMTAAKLLAMKREVANFYSKYPEQTWKNVISVGDASYEHDAVKELRWCHAAQARERLRTKAITLPSGPSLAEITFRLHFLRLLLPTIVHHDGDLDLNLGAHQGVDPIKACANCLDLPELDHLDSVRRAWHSQGSTATCGSSEASQALEELLMAVRC